MRRMYKFRKTIIDYPHKTCIMKGVINDVINVANGTKVLLIDTFVNYFHCCLRETFRGFQRPSMMKNFRNVVQECTVTECRADEYTFDRLIYELAILSTNNGIF